MSGAHMYVCMLTPCTYAMGIIRWPPTLEGKPTRPTLFEAPPVRDDKPPTGRPNLSRSCAYTNPLEDRMRRSYMFFGRRAVLNNPDERNFERRNSHQHLAPTSPPTFVWLMQVRFVVGNVRVRMRVRLPSTGGRRLWLTFCSWPADTACWYVSAGIYAFSSPLCNWSSSEMHQPSIKP